MTSKSAAPMPKKEPISPNDIIALGKLSLLFGRTMRGTFHEDGKRPESDTDHTVMLGLVASGIAQQHYQHLDLGLIAQFALVHDLVEAYAQDTRTLKIDAAGKADKAKRERAALKRIEEEFSDSFPLIPELINRYEERVEPEARFVKAVDKIIPKITHILNRGATLRDQNIQKHEAEATYKQQGKDMLEYAADFPELLELREKMIQRMMQGLQP